MHFKSYLLVILAAICTYLSIYHFNFYFFGKYDQTITVAFVKSIINPELYPNDILISQKNYLLTYFWEVIAFLCFGNFDYLPTIFFGIFLISLFLTFYTLARLANYIFDSNVAVVLVLLIVIIKHHMIGYSTSLDNMLVTRMGALPILLFSIEQFLKKRYLFTFSLVGIAFLVHALFASYTLAILTVPFIWNYRAITLKKHGASYLLFLGIISPLIIKKILTPLPNPLPFFADKEWLSLLRIRSSHHAFPSTWSLDIFLTTVGMLALFFVSLWYLKQLSVRHELRRMSYAFLLLFLVGWFFTEVVPITLVVQFQFFRSSVLLFYLVSIVSGGALIEAIRTSNFKVYLLITGISYSLFYTLVKVDVNLLYGAYVAITGILFLATKLNFNLKLTHAALAITFALFVYLKFDQGRVIMTTQQKKPWLAVQEWAKENTAQNALFIIPPAKEGFRMDGERTIYVNHKEGTYLFFNLDYGREWYRRMKVLGYVPEENLDEPYKKLNEEKFEAIKKEMSLSSKSPTYVVTYPDHKLDYSIVFSNTKYTVYQL